MEQYIAYIGAWNGSAFHRKFSVAFEAATREEAQRQAMEALSNTDPEHTAVRLQTVSGDYTWDSE